MRVQASIPVLKIEKSRLAHFKLPALHLDVTESIISILATKEDLFSRCPYDVCHRIMFKLVL